MKISGYPKVETVNPLRGKRLRVRFNNGKEKIFDCHALLNKTPFTAFKNESFFRGVKVDAGGYGISWSDNIDLSESELWTKGAALNKSVKNGAKS
ncbi:MAG: DUF2442 domain-containing protein [Verrucomicrobia bacterium]|nr:DUF2442 domain-containing protein [Verrucomicrobiota bacterium]MBU1735248.1 DUF2442 domain-containing protein [Verrucomicrobiota bacterium]MBU1857614.1 DUF2442 domain-containing protein [Verrucomicrobiota bacterium]